MKVFFTLILLVALSVGITGPGLAIYGQDAEPQVKEKASAKNDEAEPPIPLEILAFAKQVASTLKFGDDGTVSAASLKNLGFSREQRSVVDKLVADIKFRSNRYCCCRRKRTESRVRQRDGASLRRYRRKSRLD